MDRPRTLSAGIGIIAMLVASGSVASSAVLSATPNTADARTDGTTVSESSANVLTLSNNVYSGVFVFALPALPTGETVDTSVAANLTFLGNGSADSPPFNLDLYGLGYRTNAAVQAGDHFTGDYGTDGTDATPLIDNAFTATTRVGTGPVSLDSTTLAAYIKAQYDAGAQAGDFVFLRLSTDGSAPNKSYFLVATEDGRADPALTFTTAVPEPTALVLGGVTAAALLSRRRRR